MAATGNGEALRPLLTRLCATYLLDRRPLRRPGGGGSAGATADAPHRVRDPVAHFHFGNGALLQGLHWRCVAALVHACHVDETSVRTGFTVKFPVALQQCIRARGVTMCMHGTAACCAAVLGAACTCARR